MRHGIRRSIEIVVLAIISFPMWGGAIAEAGPLDASLRGDYTFAITRSCALDSGFNADFTRQVGGSDFTVTIGGKVTYNGTGGGSFVGQGLVINHDNDTIGLLPVVSQSMTCTITYTVNADGSFTETRNCNLTILNGPNTGATATLNGITLQGQIALDGTILGFASTTPNVETFTFLTGLAPGVINKRVCNGVGAAFSRR